MIRRLALVLLALAAVPAGTLAAQEFTTSLPETNAAMFAPLDLPPPNAYRAADGRPGPDYWQQRADYDIAVSLDTLTHRVSGTVEITYTNNSPFSLPYLWLHLEQNLFDPGSRGGRLTPAGSRWEGAFDDGGYELGEITIAHDGMRHALTPTVNDTRMRLDLPMPMASGETVTLTIPYSFVTPEYGADRMGMFEAARGTVYEYAQWYPKMAVYDDVNGWNAMPYLGQGEFYLGYGDFDIEITVPEGMVVVSTGAHTSAEQNYSATELARLEQARASSDRVYIVTPDEAGSRSGAASSTWTFRAENVRDVAWATSNAFILDGAGIQQGEGLPGYDGPSTDVLILSAYPHEGVSDDPENPGWEEATRFGRHSIVANSRWYPYPYPVAISVAGTVGGMEYPMLHFSSVEARHFSLFGVIEHELGHNWFPMIVGSDERRHAWMDEGFNSFLNVFSNVAFYDENPDATIAGYGRSADARVVRLTRSPAIVGFMLENYSLDQPIATYPDQIRRVGLGFLAYRKPAKGLLILRDHVLGPERFDAAFEAYIERWAYKHPQPADFFRTMEDVSGEDLDWFWRGWFLSTGTYDAAVADVVRTENGSGVTVENRGELVMPVDLLVTFDDGGTTRVRVPVEAFYQSDSFTASVDDARPIARVQIDPDDDLPDVDPENNIWDRDQMGG